MTKRLLLSSSQLRKKGQEIYSLAKRLYPICRSLTGDGVRETLRILKRHIPMALNEVPSGTSVFDWTVPKEWNIRDAYIKDPRGKKIIDFKKLNLHVLNYSVPVRKKISLENLKKHLYSLPDHPDWVPYFTSYYTPQWGFCLSHRQREGLEKGLYTVVIDSSLKEGALSYGELYIPGASKDEVLLSTYLCHPSLCNDNLSGVTLLTYLAKYLKTLSLHYSYRFLFVPETIGSIAWLSRNEKTVSRIKHGLVVTCVGDPGHSTYKKSRRGDALIDQAVEKMLIDSQEPYEILNFFPSGSDERQFCSPGFNLPVGSLMRTPYGRFPQYHTSADNLDFIDSSSLANSFDKYLKTIFILENNKTYVSLNQKCEPQLGRRGLYQTVGGHKKERLDKLSLLWMMNLSDGHHSLLDIAMQANLPFDHIKMAADTLVKAGLLIQRPRKFGVSS